MEILLVGDESAGKTSILTKYTANAFSVQHLPIMFDLYSAIGTSYGENYDLYLWDLLFEDPEDDTNWSRKFHCPDAVLVCVPVNSMESFVNVKDKWGRFVETHAHGVPIVLVGTKCDLRDDPHEQCVTPSMAEQMRIELGAGLYLECSAKNSGDSLQDVLDATVTCVVENPARPFSPALKCDGLPDPVLRSWMGYPGDLVTCLEALEFHAPRSALATRLTTARYMDTIRAQGYSVYGLAGWVVEECNLRDRDTYVEAYECGAPPRALTSRKRAQEFLNTLRAAGTHVKTPPSWVCDSFTEDVYAQARAIKAPPRVLNSRTDTETYLYNFHNTGANAELAIDAHWSVFGLVESWFGIDVSLKTHFVEAVANCFVSPSKVVQRSHM